MSYNLVDPTTGDLTKVAGNSNIVDTAIEIDSTWSSKKISADLADKQDFRIFNSLEEFNKKKGTSLTVVSGIDNMKDIVNAMSNGEMLIIITKCETGSEVYFGLTSSTGWTKMFTFIKSNGLCDVECCTTYPLTLKRVLNSDGVIGEWQQLATTDKLGELPLYSGNLNDLHPNGFAKYKATYSNLTNAPTVSYTPQMCYIDVWSDTANIYQMIRIVGVTYNPIADYSNTYIRSSHYTGSEYVWSAWGKVCTTSVEDVPITYINTFENETYVKPAISNVCSYYVSNGNCIITIESVCLSTSTNFTQIISGLPKPKTTLYANAIDRMISANSGARGLFQLTRNGDLNITCDYGDTSVVTTRYFYVSFSYPVAES